MLIYSELLSAYTLKDNSSKYDQLNNTKEKRLPRFALSEKNKNRQLYETQMNSTSDFHSYTMNSSNTTTMISSYRLPMFPTLFSNYENNQNYYTLSDNKTINNDDTDSNNSQITLAAFDNLSNNSVKYHHSFNDQCLLKNEIFNKEQLNNLKLVNNKNYETNSNIKECKIIKGDTMETNMNLVNNEMRNSLKCDNYETSDRVRHIDKLFCELSRKMYCLSERNGSLMNNLFKVTEHLKYFKSILQNHPKHCSTIQPSHQMSPFSQIENSSYQLRIYDSPVKQLNSPYQNDDSKINRLKLKTPSGIHNNQFSYSQPNLNHDVNYCNNIDTSITHTDAYLNHHHNSNESNHECITCTMNARMNKSSGYRTETKTTNEHNVQKSNKKLLHQSQTNRIPQIFTKANRFTTINLTASLFRNTSKERSRKKPT
ncbi:hypothetical protein EWB00_002963 [Schistosoma japonicum]|uniref:Uncharacterized protein n=3 Tax=Schistosoma japonicum TaxID=6182 RepID=A0A4Z2DB97_SCHJA|nr:hypothetical protein EWB00_002963 [Schistosoma japonicum]